MNKTYNVVVTGNSAILKKGSVAKVMDCGQGFWGILESNGVDMSPACCFLIENRDFNPRRMRVEQAEELGREHEAFQRMIHIFSEDPVE